MENLYESIESCRLCGHAGEFQLVYDLGEQYIVDFPKEKSLVADKAPLVMVRCTSCDLLQLAHTVHPDRLFKTFWYKSGINESMRRALRDLAITTATAARLTSEDKVLDIGANDGTLLSIYKEFTGAQTVGVDPADEVIHAGVRAKNMDLGITGYFPNIKELWPEAPFKVINAVAMFYDVDDPILFLHECKRYLDDDGVLVIQQNYLGTMLEDCAVDNICHEHLCYYTAGTMTRAVEGAQLEIQGAEINSVNGGSLRLYITHPGKSLSGLSMQKQAELYTAYKALLLKEQQDAYDTDAPYEAFRNKVYENVDTLARYCRELNAKKGKIYLYGASTRVTTLLQLLNLPEGTIKAAADRDEQKWGRLTVGSWIPILSEEVCRKDAEVFLVGPWHFKETIIRREDAFLAQGGKLLFPLPAPYLYEHDDQAVETPLVGGAACGR